MARVSIEDCLENMENRFALCAVASDRARKLIAGEVDSLIKSKNKEAVTALREIADGLIVTDSEKPTVMGGEFPIFENAMQFPKI